MASQAQFIASNTCILHKEFAFLTLMAKDGANYLMNHGLKTMF